MRSIFSTQLSWVTAVHQYHKTHRAVSERWGFFFGPHVLRRCGRLLSADVCRITHVDQRRKVWSRRSRCYVRAAAVKCCDDRRAFTQAWEQRLEDRKEHIASIICNLRSGLSQKRKHRLFILQAFHGSNTSCSAAARWSDKQKQAVAEVDACQAVTCLAEICRGKQRCVWSPAIKAIPALNEMRFHKQRH